MTTEPEVFFKALSDTRLIDVHNNLHGEELNSVTATLHHTLVEELKSRNIDHENVDCQLHKMVVLKSELILSKERANSIIKQQPTSSGVHVNTIMGRKKKKKRKLILEDEEIEKGDKPGHPFRGNQHGGKGGEGTSGRSIYDRDPGSKDGKPNGAAGTGNIDAYEASLRETKEKRANNVEDKAWKQGEIEGFKEVLGMSEKEGTAHAKKLHIEVQDTTWSGVKGTTPMSFFQGQGRAIGAVFGVQALWDKDLSQILEKSEIEKGDKPGHPFRGNQHSGKGGGAGGAKGGASATTGNKELDKEFQNVQNAIKDMEKELETVRTPENSEAVDGALWTVNEIKDRADASYYPDEVGSEDLYSSITGALDEGLMWNGQLESVAMPNIFGDLFEGPRTEVPANLTNAWDKLQDALSGAMDVAEAALEEMEE